MVQQQAIRDHNQAMQNFFAGTHGRPSWRKANRKTSTSLARRFDVIRVEDLKVKSMTRVACHFACNADVNAARNIAAGHAVKARRGDGASRPANREPQLALLPA